MKRTTDGLWIVILLIALAVVMLNFRLSNYKSEPKGLIAQSTFGKENGALGEFNYSLGLTVKGNYLYIVDTDISHLQILKINPDGSLFAQSVFGKKGKGLGEFDRPRSLVIKEDNIYIADSANNRIQILKMNSDGSQSF